MEEGSVPSLLLLVLPAPTTLCEPPTPIAVLMLDSPRLCEKLQGVSASQPLTQCLALSRNPLKPMELMDEFAILPFCLGGTLYLSLFSESGPYLRSSFLAPKEAGGSIQPAFFFFLPTALLRYYSHTVPFTQLT